MKKILFTSLLAFGFSCPLQATLNSSHAKQTPLPSFNEITKVKSDLVSFFKNLKDEYENGIKSFDAEKVGDALDLLDKADSTNLLEATKNAIKQNSSKKEQLTMDTVSSYREAKQNLGKQLKSLQKSITKKGLINKSATTNATREKYYKGLYGKLCFLTNIEKSDHIPASQNNASKKIITQLADDLEDQNEQILKKIKYSNWQEKALGNTLEKEILPEINTHECALKSINQYLNGPELKVEELKVKDKIREVEAAVHEKVDTLIGKEKQTQQVADALILVKKIGNKLRNHKKILDQKIGNRLRTYKEVNKKNKRALGILSDHLKEDKSGIGLQIIEQYPILEAERAKLFARRMQAHGINYILENLHDGDTNLLEKLYNEFLKSYKRLVIDGLEQGREEGNEAAIRKVTSSATSLTKKCVQFRKRKIKWDAYTRGILVPEILAHIFAVWTLQKSQLHHENASKKEQKGFSDYLRQPHAAQIIAIFRILGIDEKKNSSKKPLANHFAQVGTGEGKSLIAAGTACLLALLGFNIDAACYSTHLVNRDYNNFHPLFTAFSVTKYIRYQSFQKLCENTINQGIDIRKAATNLILRNKEDDDEKKEPESKDSEPTDARHSILLVDEADVFINSLYGNYYAPVASVKSPAIEQLIRYIWGRREKICLKKLIKHAAYIDCCKKMKGWESLLQEACKDIKHAFASAHQLEKSKDYVVFKGKIGYNQEDTINCNICYGYQTLRNYFFEYSKGNITNESLKANIALYIKLGVFSYAEIPKDYSCIIGVTGTLQSLSDKQKYIVEKIYDVKRNTFMPSLYGKRNSRFSKRNDLKIVAQEDYYEALVKEINKRIIGKANIVVQKNDDDDDEKVEAVIQDEEMRAVIVVFQNKKSLYRFYQSQEYLAFQDQTQIMTEELDSDERAQRISQAGRSGIITLMVKSFARGTDIPCNDRTVKKNGGIHLILTYLPEEYSEEKQAFGRVARQGEEGSVSLCLNLKDLEAFGIKSMKEIEVMRDNNDCYEQLHKRRTKAFDVTYAEKIKHVDEIKSAHDEAVILRNAFRQKDTVTALKYLRQYNMGVAEGHKVRGLITIDATCSMGATLEKAKNTVYKAFENTRNVLKTQNKPVNNFEIQFAFYRNYGCYAHELLQHSGWESNPLNLSEYLAKIKIAGGWGNEAIEVGFEHALTQHEEAAIDFILLIGDAAPNTPDEITQKRKRKGEAYWKNTALFANVRSVETLLPILKKKEIPVHAFYTDKDVSTSFSKIACATGGSEGFFDATSGEGTKQLTDILSQAVLKAIGRGGDDLVKAYINKFGGKSYFK